jgi:hypothetical protein
MRFFICSIILLVVGFSAHSQVRVKTQQEQQVRRAERNMALENQAYTRSSSIENYLVPATKKELKAISHQLVVSLTKDNPDFDIERFVAKKVNGKYRNLSTDQSNLLQLYVLADAADKISNHKLEGMGELSEMTSLRLQMTMDRRSKFISTLSQMMKKVSSTQDMLVQNIK